MHPAGERHCESKVSYPRKQHNVWLEPAPAHPDTNALTTRPPQLPKFEIREIVDNHMLLYSIIDTIPGRQCMASCFFLLKQFEDVLIYLNSIKVRVIGVYWFKWLLCFLFSVSLLSSRTSKESLIYGIRVGDSCVGWVSSPTSTRFSRVSATACDPSVKLPLVENEIKLL